MKTLTFILTLFISTSLFSQFNGSGNALDFNGTTDYVEVSHDSSQNPGAAFTVEAWINADTWKTNAWEGSIVSKDTWSSISEGWVLRCGNGGRLSFNLALNNNSSWYEVQTGSLMSTNRWYHVAGTYDGSTLRLYLNGKQVGTLSQAGTITPTTVPVKFGNHARPSSSRYFDGEIDEVRIWNAALSDTTIKDYMCKKIDNNHPNYGDLISHYNIDLGSGTTVADVSGNALNGTRSGAAWTASGAAIGTESAYMYTSSWTNKSFKFGDPAGDSVTLTNVTGNPDGIHIYRVDNHPNFQGIPPGVLWFYDDRFWGIFPTTGSNVKFTFEYNYLGYPGIVSQSELNLNYRNDNADSTWAPIVSALDTTQKTLTKTLATKGEYIMGGNDLLFPFDLNSPSSSTTVNIQGNSTQTVDFDWETTQLGGGGNVTYEWWLDHDTADFSTPLEMQSSNSSGTDTIFNFEYGDVADLMTQNNVYFGQSLNAKWTVNATGGPVTKQANQPFTITFSRGIISSDKILGFFLDEPKTNDTLLVYNGGTDTEIFNWSKGNSTAGPDLSYEVQFAGHSGELENHIATFSADNSGKDTLVSISHADLATMLQNNGLANGQVFRFKWRVEATLSTLLNHSVDSQYVYLVREDDPFEGISENDISNSIKVYPNPAKDLVFVEINDVDVESAELSLMNAQGAIVRKLNLSSSISVLKLSDLNPGIYLLQLSSENGVGRRRLIIE